MLQGSCINIVKLK